MVSRASKRYKSDATYPSLKLHNFSSNSLRDDIYHPEGMGHLYTIVSVTPRSYHFSISSRLSIAPIYWALNRFTFSLCLHFFSSIKMLSLDEHSSDSVPWYLSSVSDASCESLASSSEVSHKKNPLGNIAFSELSSYEYGLDLSPDERIYLQMQSSILLSLSSGVYSWDLEWLSRMAAPADMESVASLDSQDGHSSRHLYLWLRES